MKRAEAWRARAATFRAIVLLLWAKFLVSAVSLSRWRNSLGLGGTASVSQVREAGRHARQIERGAWRIGLPVKCLPRAMALSWRLRSTRIPHRLVIVVRPRRARNNSADPLHAWIECGGTIVLGELPGPWLQVFSAPQSAGSRKTGS